MFFITEEINVAAKQWNSHYNRTVNTQMLELLLVFEQHQNFMSDKHCSQRNILLLSSLSFGRVLG